MSRILFADDRPPDDLSLVYANVTPLVPANAFVVVAPADATMQALLAFGAQGFRGIVLEAEDPLADRLLNSAPIVPLDGIFQRARSVNLSVGVSGLIELPDMPRLLALEPDIVLVRQPMDAGERALVKHLNTTLLRAPKDGKKPGLTDTLLVSDLIIDMSVGAYASEHHSLQRVRFQVQAEVVRHAPSSDDLGHIFSYDLIVDAIRIECAREHVMLLETLGQRIADRLLRFGAIQSASLRLEKLDVGPFLVGIDMTRTRAALKPAKRARKKVPARNGP